ncbi:hypothetical protein MNQ95_13635 [Pseudoxanthomonas daejeonensis]|uniref:hypothetical protein n=1 Tax=Pseudoxanthomonas daejeonensis TaxID=266062 RepID=UPI001F545CBA|nr:hypothetical protein [Pseudoxanthomonas daejeonensis]UNK57159.1 hypothetical protein MNQ95_13635 [Pseudoxanthomonas daejeonensis]
MKNHSVMLVAAYRRLIDEQPRGDGKAGTEVPAPAALVMGALAIEIAFKALICKQNNISETAQLRALRVSDGGHNLLELFGHLDAETQFLFTAGFDKHFTQNRETIIMTSLVLDEALVEEFLRPKSFHEELALASRTFVDWRYSYELDYVSAHISFMKYLVGRVSLLFGIPEDLRFSKPPTMHKKIRDGSGTA